MVWACCLAGQHGSRSGGHGEVAGEGGCMGSTAGDVLRAVVGRSTSVPRLCLCCLGIKVSGRAPA